jgi:hypothetical protein
MLKDVRGCPKRFWEAYILILAIVVAVAWTLERGGFWFAVLVGVTAAWGIFTGCMAIYSVGQHVAYKQAQQLAEEAQSALHEMQAELQGAYERFDRLNQTFEGPS